MIIPMMKVRVLGPRPRLDAALAALQDFGLMHLGDTADAPGLEAVRPDARQLRCQRHLRRMADDLGEALRLLGVTPSAEAPGTWTGTGLPALAREARRIVRRARAIEATRLAREDERRQLVRYRDFLQVVRPVLERMAGSPRLTSYAVVVPAAARDSLDTLDAALRAEVGGDLVTATRELPGGDLAVLLVLPRTFAEKVESRLAEARVPEIPVPEGYADKPLEEAVPAMLARLDSIPRELAELEAERRALAAAHGRSFSRHLAALSDRLQQDEARRRCGVTAHAFALEGWLPVVRLTDLRKTLHERLGESVVVEELAREAWSAHEAPVVLANPRLFRPFEAIVRILPLPVYGTMDPTPFVAVFFPMFFGMILGDIGYGLALAGLGLLLHRRSRPGSLTRTVAEIAGPCAAFAIVFGAVYGELFGDLGRRWFGLHALVFDREESVTAALAVAVGIGVVHIVLGLAVGAATAWRHERRHAVGRGVSGVMVLLIVVVLLAALEVLPARLFTPAVIALLVAFPVLIAAEGLLAPLELLATLGNVLSYTRIMALGTASVMLAVVANRMVGTFGSTVVGFIFALLFHLVNFAIGLFSPTIHSMRLHFVEFFGKFYSPGGRRYEPFGHWRPPAGA